MEAFTLLERINFHIQCLKTINGVQENEITDKSLVLNYMTVFLQLIDQNMHMEAQEALNKIYKDSDKLLIDSTKQRSSLQTVEDSILAIKVRIYAQICLNSRKNDSQLIEPFEILDFENQNRVSNAIERELLAVHQLCQSVSNGIFGSQKILERKLSKYVAEINKSTYKYISQGQRLTDFRSKVFTSQTQISIDILANSVPEGLENCTTLKLGRVLGESGVFAAKKSNIVEVEIWKELNSVFVQPLLKLEDMNKSELILKKNCFEFLIQPKTSKMRLSLSICPVVSSCYALIKVDKFSSKSDPEKKFGLYVIDVQNSSINSLVYKGEDKCKVSRGENGYYET